MHHILTQRRALLTSLIGLALLLHFVALEVLVPMVPAIPDWGMLIKFVLTGGAMYSLVVLAPLKVYDTFLWRVLNPEYDFAGVWTVELYKLHPMTEAHITDEGRSAIAPLERILLENSGQATIRQTPFRTWIQEASGFSEVSEDKDIAIWTADCIATNLPGKLSVIFEASPDGGDFSGRDALVVTDRDWRKRPTEMEGKTYHVSPYLDFTIKGAIRYTRKTRRNRPAAEQGGAGQPATRSESK